METPCSDTQHQCIGPLQLQQQQQQQIAQRNTNGAFIKVAILLLVGLVIIQLLLIARQHQYSTTRPRPSPSNREITICTPLWRLEQQAKQRQEQLKSLQKACSFITLSMNDTDIRAFRDHHFQLNERRCKQHEWSTAVDQRLIMVLECPLECHPGRLQRSSTSPMTIMMECDGLSQHGDWHLSSSSLNTLKLPLPSSHECIPLRTLIISQYNEDTKWIRHLVDPLIVRYQPQRHSPNESMYIINKGNEAMVYLTYIVQHYDTLAEQMFFIHGHQWSSHSMSIPMWYVIEHMRPTSQLNYTTLNIDFDSKPRCHSAAVWGYVTYYIISCSLLTVRTLCLYLGHRDWAHIGELWNAIEPWMGPRPSSICGHSYAQFMVSRERIRLRPLAMWQAALQWLTHTNMDTQLSGRVFEYLWTCLLGSCNGTPSLTINDIITDDAVAMIPKLFKPCVPSTPGLVRYCQI
jgi:hypothetical protein